MKVEKYSLPYSYKKDNGTWVLHLDEVNWNGKFSVKETSVIVIPPKGVGGNHKHPRVEAFIALGDGLELMWQEDDGQVQQLSMDADDMLQIFVMPSGLAHAVKNTTDHEIALYELASDKQKDVEIVPLA